MNVFLSYSTNPLVASEAVLDHDYTLLAMRRSGDSSRDLWNGFVATTKRIEGLVSEPIRAFIQEDLRNFKVGLGRRRVDGGAATDVPRYRKPIARSNKHRSTTTTCKLDTRDSQSRKSRRRSEKMLSSSTKPARLIFGHQWTFPCRLPNCGMLSIGC